MTNPIFPNTQFHQNWVVRKPIVFGEKGVVACQHRAAAEVGAEVLRAGGNAVDAAIAVSFAVAAVEPWMSGIGGGGYMQVALARKGEFRCVNMGMVALMGLRLEDRSEEHTSELQALMSNSDAAYCLQKDNIIKRTTS